MSDADKRNHPRAKVLSMTVRYKSATVDDFVEHHSDNVSRGGIFIKTASPFPPGTLLKFEIRIADDEAVLAGVGRVVWKRDEPGADEVEDPAGMGVKFIKLDEKSRALIARLVDAADGKESKYDKGFAAAEKKPAQKAQKKATLLGLGAIGDEEVDAAKDKAKEPPKPEAEAAGFFPAGGGEQDQPPPEERTVMKQAAELLEQALAGAGGSMEELGTPDSEEADEGWGDLEDKKEAPKADKPAAKVAASDASGPKGREATPVAKTEPSPGAKAELAKAEPKPEARPAEAKKPEAKPAEAKKPEPKPALAKPAQPRAVAAHEAEEEEGGGKALPIVLALGVLAVLAYLFLSRGDEPTETAPPPQPTQAKTTPTAKPTTPPPESATPPPTEVPTTEPATSTTVKASVDQPPPPPPPVRPPPVRPPPVKPPPVKPPPVKPQPPPPPPPSGPQPPPPPPPPPAPEDDIYD